MVECYFLKKVCVSFWQTFAKKNSNIMSMVTFLNTYKIYDPFFINYVNQLIIVHWNIYIGVCVCVCVTINLFINLK
jgi:hypothetical protein